MRTLHRLQPKWFFNVGIGFMAALVLALSQLPAHAQDSGEVVPASYQSGGFFSQQLGTALRFNYHTQGYGTQADVFSIGGMKVFNMEGATFFLDGQGTLSDDFGGGFNLGAGYRQLTTTGASFDAQRILGGGFWTDGQSTSADNFFTQLGFSLESLGESYDLRLNGYFPLERTKMGDSTLTSLGSPIFSGNNIFNATETLSIDTAHSVVDGEFAKRINDLEAWAFLGGYQIGGGGQDATGYRVGVRGYAVPDLALSLQVTDDDIYATNVVFGVTWFIGRTNKCNQPCGTILDRFRQPVLRNDFIATTQQQVFRASGDAATDPDTNLAKNFVFVNSNAAAGGDGTFENPFRTLTEAQGVLADNDTVFSFSNSTYTDALNLSVVENASFLGEGNDIVHVCETGNFGLVTLPETSPGARSLAAPELNLAGGTAFTAGNNSMINNATINGATTGVLADSVTAPQLANLAINTPVDGVILRNSMGTTVVENTVVVDGATGIGVLVEDGDAGVDIAATINNTAGQSLVVQNKTGGTVEYTGTIDDDEDGNGGFSDGVLIAGNVDTIVNFTNMQNIRVDDGEEAIEISGNTRTTVSGNASAAVDLTATGTGRGLVVSGNDSDSSITFADLMATAVDGDTVSITGSGSVTLSSADDTRTIENTGTGNAVFNDGTGGNDALTVNSDIVNTGGGTAVRIINRAEDNTAQFTGTVTATGGAGVFAQDNSMGTILFTQSLTLDSGTNNAVELVNNTGALLSFNGFDIDTTDGDGFVATGGGTLLVTSPDGTNSVDVTGTGVGVNLNGMTIDTGNVVFDTVSVGNGAGVGIDLQSLDGDGTVTIGGGTNPGDGGTLTTAGTAINVNDADNVVVNNVTISNAGAAQGVSVTGQMAGSTATFNGINANTVDGDAVNVSGNTDGSITFNDLVANTSGTGGAVVVNNNADATVTINGMEATATASGAGFRATGTGNLTVSGDTSISTNTGQALEIDGQTIVGSGAEFDTVDVTAATNAVTLRDVTGQAVRIGSGTTAGDGGTVSTTGTAITIDNVEDVQVSNVIVDNDTGPTTGAGLNVTNQAAGSTATVSSLTVRTTTADAVTVSGNADGTTIFTDLAVETTDGTGVTVANNNAATTTFNGMEVEATGTGVGFTANGTGTVVATGTNNITTNTGVAVNLDNTTIGGAGAGFSSVNVTNGATNGVVLNDLTGGQVRVGSTSATGTDGAGGTLTTADTAIMVTGVTNAVFNDVTVDNASNEAVLVNHTSNNLTDVVFDNLSFTSQAGAGDGLVINDNGNGELDVILRNSELNTTASGNVGFVFNAGANSGEVDITLQDNTLTAAGSNAFFADLDQGTGDVQFLLNGGNSFDNDSLTNAAADFSVTAARTLNATIGSQTNTPPFDENSFTNANAGGTAFEMTLNNAAGNINLDIRGNSANGGSIDFLIGEVNGDFGVVDRTDTITNNVNNTGTFNLNGGVEADFDDLSPPIKQVD